MIGGRASRWQHAVESQFSQLLSVHSFVLRDSSADNWGEKVVYTNATTGLKVYCSVEFNRVEISLIRLVDGAIPPYPIFVSNTPVLHEFLIDNILRIRAPELDDELTRMVGIGKQDCERDLTTYAKWLEEYAADVLEGDFAVFATAETEVRRRVAQNPEKIQVWMPSTSTEQEREQAKSHAESAPGIRVVLRKYWRRRR